MKKRLFIALLCLFLIVDMLGGNVFTVAQFAGMSVVKAQTSEDSDTGDADEEQDEDTDEDTDEDDVSDDDRDDEDLEESSDEEESSDGSEDEEESEESEEESSEEEDETGDSDAESEEETEETEDLEETEETEELFETESEEAEAFSDSVRVNGILVKVEADEGVFPQGAYIRVREIKGSKIESIEEAVSAELPAKKKVTAVKAFDITVYDEDDHEIQPDTDKGSVQVTFENIDTSKALASPKADVQVFHVSDDGDEAEAVDTEVAKGEVRIDAEHFSTYAVVSVEDVAANPALTTDEHALVDSAVIKKGSTTLTEGATISFSDTFSIEYKMKDPLYINVPDWAQEAGNVYISTGKTYRLPRIDALAFDVSAFSSVPVKLNDGKEFGTLSVESDGTVKLNVTYNDPDKEELHEVMVKMALQLNRKSIGEQEEYDFTIPGTSTKLTMKISENQPAAPTVTKTAGAYDSSDDTIAWTVHVKNAKHPITYANGYVFKDTFSEGQSYVTGSFKVEVNGTAAVPAVPAYDASERTLTYSYTNNTALSDTVITYKTHIDFLAGDGAKTNGPINYTAKNKFQVFDAEHTSTGDDPVADDSASKAVTKTLRKWIEKDGGVLNADGSAEWTIKVDTNGYSYRKLNVYDRFIADNETAMTLKSGSVSVSRKNNATNAVTNLTEGSDYVIHSGSGTTGGSAYSWYLEFCGSPLISGDNTYTITYTTEIDDYANYLQQNHSLVPSNKAWLGYEYDWSGNGDWVEVTGPDVSKKMTGRGAVTNAAIDKALDKFDAATHRISWKVTVNKTYEALTGVTVNEILGEGQHFYSVSDASLTASDGSSAGSFSMAGHYQTTTAGIEIDFGSALSGKKAVFTVVTELNDTEKSFYANNAKKKYANRVKLHSDQQLQDIETKAEKEISSTVLEKMSGTYNYDTHTIDYTITVNRNQMAMHDTFVKDDIGALGLSLVDGTVKLNDVVMSTDPSAKPYYTDTNGLLEFHLADITDSIVGTEDATEIITFTAKVDDGDIFTSVNNANVEIGNTAKLTTREYEAEVSVATKTTFKNSVIKKTASSDKNNNTATYTVTFNGNKQLLPANLIVRDTLGASFDLDPSSVKLCIGQINASTGAITSTGTEEAGYTVSVKPETSGKTIMDVKLPQRADNRNIYVLTYTVTATDEEANDYTNEIQLLGYANSSVNSSSANLSETYFFSGWAASKTYLKVTKVDKDDKNVKLAGAIFEVLDGTTGDVVTTIVSKADGVATSIGKLNPDTTYKLREKTAPEGYVKSEEPITFKTNAKGGARNAYTIEFPNEKASKMISIKKENAGGEGLAGAELEVTYEKLDGSVASSETWTSTTGTKTFKASHDVVYTLKETKAPFGYETADDIKFYVDGASDTLKIWQPDSATYVAASDDTVTMTDVLKGTNSFTADKQSEGQGISLSGASLVISEHTDGSHPIFSWTSDGSPKQFALPAGEYYMVETAAPNGFTVASPLRFKFSAAGQMSVWNTTASSYEDVSENAIVMKDAEDPAVTVNVDMNEQDIYNTMLSGIEMKLYKFSANRSSTMLLDSWITDGTHHNLILQHQTLYLLTESAGLAGYLPTQSVVFKISNDGNVMIENTDGSFTDSGDNKAILTARQVPSKSSGSGGSSHHHHHHGSGSSESTSATGTEEQLLLVSPDSIDPYGNEWDPAVAAEKMSDTRVSGAHLAKTGGFMGTPMSYGAGIVMMLAGLFLLFGKKKKIHEY